MKFFMEMERSTFKTKLYNDVLKYLISKISITDDFFIMYWKPYYRPSKTLNFNSIQFEGNEYNVLFSIDEYTRLKNDYNFIENMFDMLWNICTCDNDDLDIDKFISTNDITFLIETYCDLHPNTTTIEQFIERINHHNNISNDDNEDMHILCKDMLAYLNTFDKSHTMNAIVNQFRVWLNNYKIQDNSCKSIILYIDTELRILSSNNTIEYFANSLLHYCLMDNEGYIKYKFKRQILSYGRTKQKFDNVLQEIKY